MTGDRIRDVVTSYMNLRARAYPLGALLRRLSGKPHDLVAVAVESTVLAPEETEIGPGLIMLPDQFARARAMAPGVGTLADELGLLGDERITHAPVIRHTFRDCLVRPHGVDAPGGRLAVGPDLGYRPVSGPLPEIDSAHFCMTGVSNHFFGHWLLDACATALLPEPDEMYFLSPFSARGHAPDYLAAFRLKAGIPPACLVRRLHIYQDYAQGTLKRARYATMRDRLRQKFPGTPRGGDRLYIRRGGSGQARPIADEDSLVARLVDDGFEVLDIADASLAEIQERGRRARVVVSMEGSHLCHMHLAMPQGGCMIALMPADRVSAMLGGFAQAVGLRFGLLMMEPTETGYRVDVDDLRRTIELADTALTRDPDARRD